MNTLFKNWKVGELYWLFFAISVVLIAANGNILDLATTLTMVTYIILLAKGRSSAFVWGLVGILLYALTVHDAGFEGKTVMCLIYYFPMSLIGLFQWMKHTKKGESDVTVRTLTTKSVVMLDASILTVTILFALILNTWLPNSHPWVNAFIAAAAVAAKWLSVNRYSEQWPLWIMVSAANIYVWSHVTVESDRSYAMVTMSVVFFLTSIYGAYKWFYVKTNK